LGERAEDGIELRQMSQSDSLGTFLRRWKAVSSKAGDRLQRFAGSRIFASRRLKSFADGCRKLDFFGKLWALQESGKPVGNARMQA
jgi:hypothetical protein